MVEIYPFHSRLSLPILPGHFVSTTAVVVTSVDHITFLHPFKVKYGFCFRVIIRIFFCYQFWMKPVSTQHPVETTRTMTAHTTHTNVVPTITRCRHQFPFIPLLVDTAIFFLNHHWKCTVRVHPVVEENWHIAYWLVLSRCFTSVPIVKLHDDHSSIHRSFLCAWTKRIDRTVCKGVCCLQRLTYKSSIPPINVLIFIPDPIFFKSWFFYITISLYFE